MFAGCSFDICQLWNGLLLGTTASGFAAIIVILVEKYLRKKDLREKFGKAAGSYLGYGFEKTGEPWTLKENAQSEATITYVKE